MILEKVARECDCAVFLAILCFSFQFSFDMGDSSLLDLSFAIPEVSWGACFETLSNQWWWYKLAGYLRTWFQRRSVILPYTKEIRLQRILAILFFVFQFSLDMGDWSQPGMSFVILWGKLRAHEIFALVWNIIVLTGVVSSGEVVGRVLLSADELLGVEERAVGARAHLVNHRGLRSRNISRGTCWTCWTHRPLRPHHGYVTWHVPVSLRRTHNNWKHLNVQTNGGCRVGFQILKFGASGG